jgi:hypothetical protein
MHEEEEEHRETLRIVHKVVKIKHREEGQIQTGNGSLQLANFLVKN